MPARRSKSQTIRSLSCFLRIAVTWSVDTVGRTCVRCARKRPPMPSSMNCPTIWSCSFKVTVGSLVNCSWCNLAYCSRSITRSHLRFLHSPTDPSNMIKLYGKIIEFQNMQNGIVQKQVFQQVGLLGLEVLEPIVDHYYWFRIVANWSPFDNSIAIKDCPRSKTCYSLSIFRTRNCSNKTPICKNR